MVYDGGTCQNLLTEEFSSFLNKQNKQNDSRTSQPMVPKSPISEDIKRKSKLSFSVEALLGRSE